MAKTVKPADTETENADSSVDPVTTHETPVMIAIEQALGMPMQEYIGRAVETSLTAIMASLKQPSVQIKITDERSGEVSYATPGAACVDLRACTAGCCTTIMPGHPILVDSGISAAIPEGYVGLMFIRSSAAAKRGLYLVNQVGVIDSDYRGNIMICLGSTKTEGTRVTEGERVAQLAFIRVDQLPIEFVSELPATERGEGGIGSTGVK